MPVQKRHAICVKCQQFKWIRIRGLCERCYVTGPCKNCGKVISLRRNLCYRCWHTPEIRRAQPVGKYAAKSVVNPLYSEAEECERAEELAVVMRRLTGNPMTVEGLAADMGLTQQQAESLVDDLRIRKLVAVSRNNGKINTVGWWKRDSNRVIRGYLNGNPITES